MDEWWVDMLCLMDVCLFLAFSDLDRDFWNNNDSNSEQQRWSSYPPKEFVLNISPYAPYGDPRLTLKWVSVQAGKRPNPYPTDPPLTTRPFIITPATRQGCRVQMRRQIWHMNFIQEIGKNTTLHCCIWFIVWNLKEFNCSPFHFVYGALHLHKC